VSIYHLRLGKERSPRGHNSATPKLEFPHSFESAQTHLPPSWADGGQDHDLPP
jgi:hypothetical protein